MTIADQTKFAISGITSCSSIWVPPHSEHKLPLLFLPLCSGTQSLPKICVAPKSLMDSVQSGSAVFLSAASPVLTRSIFIKPTLKQTTFVR